MILSTHFIAGAAAASYTDSPLLIIVLPLVLHFLLDMIPHWEYAEDVSELKNKIPQVVIDLLAGPIAALLIFILKFGFNLEMITWLLIGGMVSLIPDGFSLLYFIFPKVKLFKRVFSFHEAIHNKKLLGFKAGFSIQLVIDLLAIILIVLPKA